MSIKTKIEWTEATWNPVTGCEHNCPYCYARGIARRFGGYWLYAGLNEEYIPGEVYDPPMGVHSMDREPIEARELNAPHLFKTKKGKFIFAPYPYGFAPTFHRYRLDEPQTWKEPRTVFVDSMCDLFGDWIPDSWIEEVFKACKSAPQHRYLFLTKNPKRYMKLIEAGKLPQEHWYGETATHGELRGLPKPYKHFVSGEPLHGELGISPLTNIDWIITGAETGNRKGKIIPKRE